MNVTLSFPFNELNRCDNFDPLPFLATLSSDLMKPLHDLLLPYSQGIRLFMKLPPLLPFVFLSAIWFISFGAIGFVGVFLPSFA